MLYRALATDYDGTLATHGTVDCPTIAALERFLASGRKLILVTGRELADLERVFPKTNLFTLVVAENGALVYDPATAKQELLCPAAPRVLIEELHRKGVPVSVGRAVVATVARYEIAVRDTITELGLPLHISSNKGSIMVLPEGVNKVTGLHDALTRLGLQEGDVVAIGDAENDLDFITACGCGVAVANATPEAKSRANLITRGAHGRGVAEVIDELLSTGRLGCNRRLEPE